MPFGQNGPGLFKRKIARKQRKIAKIQEGNPRRFPKTHYVLKCRICRDRSTVPAYQEIPASVRTPMVRTLCPHCQCPGSSAQRHAEGTRPFPLSHMRKAIQGRRGLGRPPFPAFPDRRSAGLLLLLGGIRSGLPPGPWRRNTSLGGLHISPQTVRRWVQEYTDAAIGVLQGHRVSAGTKWVLCRMPCSSGTRVCWLVVDQASGFILGSHVGADGRAVHATAAIEEALASAISPVTEMSYAECALRGRVLRLVPRSTPSSAVLQIVGDLTSSGTPVAGIRASDCESLSFAFDDFLSSWHGISKTFNRHKDPDQLEQCVKGWAITRNYLRREQKLGGRTPGQAVDPVPAFAGWTELVTQHSRNSARVGRGNQLSCSADDSAPG